ncbi:TPA: hypothetical protein DF272_03690 [Candidatus Falkowbacteria bacterium]|nr:hypothetical protein [Candidatus Falkowbacteria bacterium]
MTDDEIKQLAETILLEEDEFLIPILKLYDLMDEEKNNLKFEPDHLIELLNRDDRFVLLNSQSTQEPWPDEDDETMQSLGYYKGPRVMHKDRMPSREVMMQAITGKMQNTLSSLKSAYHVMPDNLSDDEEEEFLQVMQRVKDLSKKIDDVAGPETDQDGPDN